MLASCVPVRRRVVVVLRGSVPSKRPSFARSPPSPPPLAPRAPRAPLADAAEARVQVKVPSRAKHRCLPPTACSCLAGERATTCDDIPTVQFLATAPTSLLSSSPQPSPNAQHDQEREKNPPPHTRHARRVRHMGPPTQPLLRLAHCTAHCSHFPWFLQWFRTAHRRRLRHASTFFFPAVPAKADARLTHPPFALRILYTTDIALSTVTSLPRCAMAQNRREKKRSPAGLSRLHAPCCHLAGCHLDPSIHHAMQARACVAVPLVVDV